MTPVRRIATINRDVATGRAIKGFERFIGYAPT